jgi:hypothetical protein
MIGVKPGISIKSFVWAFQKQVSGTWMWVLISLALSAYFRVFVVWWYWSAPEQTVATITVREFPLRPSFRSLVNLLQKQNSIHTATTGLGVWTLSLCWTHSCTGQPTIQFLWYCKACTGKHWSETSGIRAKYNHILPKGGNASNSSRHFSICN